MAPGRGCARGVVRCAGPPGGGHFLVLVLHGCGTRRRCRRKRPQSECAATAGFRHRD